MKRILSISFACLLIASAFIISSCEKKDDEPTDETTANITDISQTSLAPTTEEQTTASGPRKQYKELILFVDDGTQVPCSISDVKDTIIGMKFTADFNIESVDISCPSWSDNAGKMTFTLYEWKTDYATTVAGTPVNQQDIVDYEDNSLLSFPIEEGKATGGTYLWTLSAGSGGVGTWAVENGINPDEGDIMSFKNGTEDKLAHKATINGYKMVE